MVNSLQAGQMLNSVSRMLCGPSSRCEGAGPVMGLNNTVIHSELAGGLCMWFWGDLEADTGTAQGPSHQATIQWEKESYGWVEGETWPC